MCDGAISPDDPPPRFWTRLTPDETSEISLRSALEMTVAQAFEIDVALLRQPTRGRARVALARQVLLYLAHVRCGLSMTSTGELFGRDRTTVAHACAVIEEKREDVRFDKAIDLLERVVAVTCGLSMSAAWRRAR